MRIGDLAEVRSKNAGPFWITFDLFCGDAERHSRLAGMLTVRQFAALLRVDPQTVRMFSIPDLAVLKFSVPRPVPQGDARDRDLHGAAWAALLAESELSEDGPDIPAPEGAGDVAENGRSCWMEGASAGAKHRCM